MSRLDDPGASLAPRRNDAARIVQGLIYLVRHTEALRIYTGDYDKQDVENFVKMDLGPLPEVAVS